MSDWTVPLSDVRFNAPEIDAIADVYRRGWISQGPIVAEFERAFADFLGRRHAIAVANGTAALHLICIAVGLRRGDEVVVPSMTFAATAAAVVHAGGVPVFADISRPGRPWISPETVEPVLTDRTRAIISVSYAGHPGAVDRLRAFAQSRGLVLIEDAAHGPGGGVADEPVGTFGQLAAFSFFANKNMPLGEGGMVVTDDDELSGLIRLFRSHGMTSDTWTRHRGDAVDYDVLVPGYNYRLDEARASVGLLLLRRLGADNQRRAAVARHYAEGLEELPGIRPAVRDAPPLSSAWHIYPVLLDPSINRSSFRSVLRSDGVQTSVHYPPLHRTQAFSRYCSRPLPATDNYGGATVTIPLFPHMTPLQQTRVIEAIRSAVKPT